MKLGVLLMVTVARIAVAQGFGGALSPRRMTLEVALPAVVNLENRKVNVTVRRPGRPGGTPGVTVGTDPVVAGLRAKLAAIVRRVPGAVLEEHDAALEVDVEVTDYQVTAESRRQGDHTCTYYVGKLEGTYRTIDRAMGQTLDAANLTQVQPAPPCSNLNGGRRLPTFGGTRTPNEQGQSEAEVQDRLVNGIVAQVERHIVPTNTRFEVPLPRGTLSGISDLAASRLWTKALDASESRAALPKPEDDAYRMYLAGLANEALAYQDGNSLEATLAFLDAAAKRYDIAALENPAEKEFVKAVERVRLANDAVKRAKLATAKPEDGTAKTLPSTSAPAPPSPVQTILDLCRANVPKIAQLIQQAPTNFAFDKPPSLAEELSIRQECGSQGSEIMAAIHSSIRPRQ